MGKCRRIWGSNCRVLQDRERSPGLYGMSSTTAPCSAILHGTDGVSHGLLLLVALLCCSLLWDWPRSWQEAVQKVTAAGLGSPSSMGEE